MPPSVRAADPERDAAACAAIYAPFVTGTAVTFEQRALDATELRERIAETQRVFPWLVCEVGGAVAGYAYAGPHRARAAYRWTTEVSVYVGEARRRAGVARALYTRLFALLAGQGFHLALAGITLPNDASVGLHRALGFTPVGVYRAVGFKAGAWHDVSWWQLGLGAQGGGPPREPRPPAERRLGLSG